jgi:pyrimidine-specific ribonucleoside hydrolase
MRGKLTFWVRSGAGLLLWALAALADTERPIIFDGDWAGDDARALALILSDPDHEVLAVVATEGACPPSVGAAHAARVLQLFQRSEVRVVMGRPVPQPPPPFRAHATSLDWDALGPGPEAPGGCPDFLAFWRALRRTNAEPVQYVCTGPLTTLAHLLRAEPAAARQIESVIWYGSGPDDPDPDWNTRLDPEAVREVQRAGLAVTVVGYPRGTGAPVMEPVWVEQAGRGTDAAARLIRTLFGQGRGAELVQARHLRFWDDLVALWLLEPGKFTLTPVSGVGSWRRATPRSVESVPVDLLGWIVEGALRQTVVLNRFPTDEAALREDVRPWARAIQERHGWEEWKLAVLTSELHRHLGTWSIVGAKMGLYAREQLRVGLDALRVESYAGLRPPLSCLNDGLQVATGASLGRGTIRVVETAAPRCEALFIHGDRRLRLRLRSEHARAIEDELARLVKEHGGLTPAYFDAVRAAALRHWLELDRKTLFEVVPDTAGGDQR